MILQGLILEWRGSDPAECPLKTPLTRFFECAVVLVAKIDLHFFIKQDRSALLHQNV
jgi:hypothetical protein